MEINKYTDIRGVIANEDIVDGRMVLIIENQVDAYMYGGRTDLVGVKLPDNSTEAAKAQFCVTFPVMNQEMPYYPSMPENKWSLRNGFAGTSSSLPFSSYVYLTPPGNMETPQTIYSGDMALAFAGGVFTVTSGHFVASATLAPGAYLTVCNTADDGAAEAGKLKYSATKTDIQVEKYDSTNFVLTFRTLQP